MNVENRSSGGVLKKGCNLGQKYRDFFRFWRTFPSQLPKQNEFFMECPSYPTSCRTTKALGIIIFIIRTLFTLGLERKIYRNEMITGKDKKVTQASHSRASGLQARLRETSNPKNAKAPTRKRRKLAHLLLWI